MGTSSAAPADWLAANGSAFPTRRAARPAAGTTAYDPVMLNVRVRVPTNAKSFSVRDVLLLGRVPRVGVQPVQRLLRRAARLRLRAGDGRGGEPRRQEPRLLRSAAGRRPGLPDRREPRLREHGAVHAVRERPDGLRAGATSGTISTCVATTQLVGTGFDVANPGAGSPAYCGTSNLVGGGTGWLVASGNVTPGETIEMRFVVWDTSDHCTIRSCCSTTGSGRRRRRRRGRSSPRASPSRQSARQPNEPTIRGSGSGAPGSRWRARRAFSLTLRPHCTRSRRRRR